MKNNIVLFFFIVQIASTRIISFDLTYEFNNETIYWPSNDSDDRYQVVKRTKTLEYEANRFCTPEHGGTHMDAPRHFAPGKGGINKINLDRLIGKAFFVDVSEQAKGNPDYLITQKNIEDAEKIYKKSVDNHIVLLYTGWSSKYPNKVEYLGSDKNDASLLRFPGLDPEAAKWLVAKREIKCIGLDTASIDYGKSTTFESHLVLFNSSIPALENVNLKEFSIYKDKKNLMIYALPMLLTDGSGAPTRIVATYDDEQAEERSDSTILRLNIVTLITAITVIILMFL